MATKEEIEAFSLKVLKIAEEKNLSHIDSVVYLCENGPDKIDIELAATLISPFLKEKIEIEAEKLNVLKEKKVRLPI